MRPAQSQATESPAAEPPTPGVEVIDVHTHYVPHGWPDLGPDTPTARFETEAEVMIMLAGREFRRVASDCWDAEIRLADMDADGVARQVVSPTPVFFSYAHDVAQATKIAHILNDLALEICAPAPGRLLPMCQVPLQDPDAACAELERCLAAGHVGVEIGNHVGDHDLDNEGVVTFLQHAAALGAPVFVHPWDMPTSPRLDRWMAQWLVGMPSETHLSILAMILGGVFDRVDEGLRICFAHGGGSFAFWLGRLGNAWHRRGDVIGTSELHPEHYLGRFYVDSVVFDAGALRLLVDTIGADRVVVGSDYPYPLGERPAGSVVHAADFLDAATRARLLAGNARDFLGLAGPTAAPATAPAAAGAGLVEGLG
ncbi:amidohydrolase family protein [Pseudofrankia inefficax]|uniref:2-amino-3-carboxymuconate-6-semialdehyde decarboxylase n=1 Tax=Pseudofrankia inefficax (strain DSM 45817 / CECT 9037 / DDB 130130 / EuI1c) TaxID=298654 RepID=E3J2E2_PSEI1|nr:amidohydrolase family protein [Pseudofrankia inefficax]ADP79314.1 amidohydrolase 2 [Pseudofrankia inefficax]